MRKLCQFFCVLIFLISISSCDPQEIKKVDDSYIENSKDSDSKLRESEIVISNQLVVWFPENLTEAERSIIRDTIKDDIDPGTPIRKCSCGSQNIELITLNDNVDVEGAISSVKGKGGGAGVEGENQFEFYLPPIVEPLNNDKYFALFDLDSIKKLTIDDINKSRVNIAIVDTGIGMFSDLNSTPYLYSTKDNLGLGCAGEVSGWNFVEGQENANASALHEHGPLVTKLIRSELEEQNIDYSILPVRAFDKDGKSSYWKIVCSLAYIKDIQEKNNDIHLVNASFGYDFRRFPDAQREVLLERQKILEKLIEQMNTSTLVITSSGNEGYDSNLPENSHFPSGFNNTNEMLLKTNLIGVGGYEGQSATIKTLGNYGTRTIDLAAGFGGYKISFDIEENPVQKVVLNIEAGGTSFSTAYTTAMLARVIYQHFENSTGQQLLPWQIKSGYFNSNDVLRSQDPLFVSQIYEGKYIGQ